MDKAVTLSSHEFKALASDTRTGIIKLLQERNHTLSELSKKMEMSAPTIKQHLSVLQNAEMVQGLDEGRKWKYYSLTRKGKNIFASEPPTNILIVLSVSVIALAAFLYLFTAAMPMYAGTGELVGVPGVVGGIGSTAAEGDGIAEPGGVDVPAETTGGIEGTEGKTGESTTGLPVEGDRQIGAAEDNASAGMQQVLVLRQDAVLLLAAIVAASLLAGFMFGKLKARA